MLSYSNDLALRVWLFGGVWPTLQAVANPPVPPNVAKHYGRNGMV
jgi:hypothetical protein